MKNLVLFILMSICSIACSSVAVKENLSKTILCSDAKTILVSGKDPIQMIENSRNMDYFLNLDAKGNKMTATPKINHLTNSKSLNQIVVYLHSGKVVFLIEQNCNKNEITLVI